MPKFGLIIPRETRVYDIAETTFKVARPFQWKAAPDDITPRWTWDGSAFQPPAARPLSEIKAERSEYINGVRNRKLAEPVIFQGNLYDTDERSVSNLTRAITFIQAAALGGETPPTEIPWRDATNVTRQLTVRQLVKLGAAIFLQVNTVYATSWALKDAIEAATTEAAVLAIDWP